jgi:predicted transcriptional regulator
MPAITIDVSDETYQQLAAMAAQRQATVEVVAVRAVEDRVREDQEFRSMAREHYREYKSMFDRLKE